MVGHTCEHTFLSLRPVSRNKFNFSIDISGNSLRPQEDKFLLPNSFILGLGLDDDAVLDTVEATTVLIRHSKFMELQVTFRISGSMKCSRCLQSLPLQIERSELYIIKFWEQEPPLDNDPNMLWLQKGETRIELTSVFCDILLALLPSRFTCAGNEDPRPCDLKVLEKLSELSVEPH